MFNNIKVVCGFVQISADPTIFSQDCLENFRKTNKDNVIPRPKAVGDLSQIADALRAGNDERNRTYSS
jgi:hypothetical protein